MRGRTSDATAQQLHLEAAWRVSRRLSLSAAHMFTFQRGGLSLERAPSVDIVHNTLLLRAVAGWAGK
jgi:hypothetical protein